MSKKIAGWGNFPICNPESHQSPATKTVCQSLMAARPCLARGLGRSYGDAANFENIIDTKRLNHFISFDEDFGILSCQAGVSLNAILSIVMPLGWFLPVTPGTSFVTIGGAIASDVHGKNHHLNGSFSDHVISMDVVLGSGEILTLSADEYTDLFLATCGGMGLTGIIFSVVLKLIPINSNKIQQQVIRTPDLEQTLAQFSKYSDSTYSVAWIDCLALGAALGRSLVILGEHCAGESLAPGNNSSLIVPKCFPSFVLNKYCIKAFNSIYHRKSLRTHTESIVNYRKFFYPLDNLQHWNRMYGSNGFVQYQFVLPKDGGFEGMKEILVKIADSGEGSFLAVLKEFGVNNGNYLSFPIEGFSLALDFKLNQKVIKLIKELDEIVLRFNGRVYLAKDSLMTESTFKSAYPQWEDFMQVREKYGAIGKFSSDLAKRVGLV